MFAHSGRTLAVLLSAAIAAALLAACGSSSGGGSSTATTAGADATRQITDMLTAGLTTSDGTVICTKTMSTGLVTRIYGTPAACVSVHQKNAATKKPATGVTVSAIKLTGDKGTALVAVKGGDQDGATGPVTVVKQTGGWRLDDLSTAYLRSELQAGLATNTALSTALKSCIAVKVLALPDAAFRTLAYGSMADKTTATDRLNGIAVACQDSLKTSSGSANTGAASVLRQKFNQGVIGSLKSSGVSAAGIACVKDKLATAISDQQIIDLVSTGGKNVPPEVTRSVTEALAACKSTG